MRNHRLLKLALGVATCALILAPMANASNMGFKLERQFDKPNAASLGNYFLSLPFFRSYDDFGSKDAFDTPDGCVTAADLLIDIFTDGDGTCDGAFPSECGGTAGTDELTIFFFDPNPVRNPAQSTVNLKIAANPFGGGLLLTGTDFPIGADASACTFDLDGDTNPDDTSHLEEAPRGFVIKVDAGSYPGIIVGSHNPDISQWSIEGFDPSTGSLNNNSFSLPYHTTFADAEALLTEIWNTTTARTGAEDIEITLIDFDPATNTFFNKKILPAPFGGGFQFSPPSPDGNFTLVPGNGYRIKVDDGGADGFIDVPLSHY